VEEQHGPDILIRCSRCEKQFPAHKDQVVEQLYWVCTHCGMRENISANDVVTILQSAEYP
jgi:hypothetical protein